jgi:hypothetical protein
MNKKVKTKWLEALRSGKYKQGKARLKREGKYCCLGVLCDISNLRTWVSVEDGDLYAGCSMLAHYEVSAWAELPEAQQYILASINDSSIDYTDSIKYIQEVL